MENVIFAVESRIKTLKEEIRYAELRDLAYMTTYKLACKELKMLRRQLKQLKKIHHLRNDYFFHGKEI